MDEEKSSGGGESSRVQSSFVKVGDRQIFTVDLRPGETTIVSWKKLLKDANKASGGSSSAPEPPALEPRVATGQVAENEEKDAPAPNRFSAVIEKIERLYMGKHSSDEEDLNDFPDDDQYDTEDSFIDDVELDEYFEVDNSAIKHDGFFVNRGKLERTNESPVLPNQQTKKRRRKELAKGPGESDDGRVLNKHGRVGTTSDGLLGKSSSSPSQSLALTSRHFEDLKLQNQLNDSGIPSKNKSADTKMPVDSSSLKVSNGNASISLAEAKDTEKQKTGVFQSKNLNLSNRLKDSGGSSDASHQKYQEKNAYTQSKSQHGRPTSNVEELEPSVRVREKNGIHKLAEINDSQSKFSMQTTKTSNIHKRDGSSVKPKSTMLERAIRELERMVAESRPPAMENQEADTSNQAIKRRLPREIKLKLAKVARLAQASHGKISEELLNRLMSILGHLIQLRTLKRNLNVMISMGLSAKQEKDDRFQLIKKEVVEMIKVRAPSLEYKAFEQQAGASDDFQEYGSEGVAKRKFSVDTALEDKICDLYDLFVDGLDEDAGPQVRKLYAELAQLWPTGLMDNHGIKRAICRAKERRRALYNRHKDQEKMKRKKMSAPRLEETVRVDTTSVVQQQHIRDKLAIESGTHHVLAAANKPVSTTTPVRIPSPSMNGPNLDRPKQEKLKGSSSNFIEEVRVSEGALPKKKVKRKADRVGQELFLPREGTQQADERHKSYNKQAVGLPQNNLQLNAPPKFEQSS